MHEALKPWSPSSKNPWDFDAASHLLRRVAFGASPDVVERTASRSPAAAVAALVNAPAKDVACADLESIYQSVLGSDDADNMRAWLVSRMARCEYQLREKMALFWHGHFATSILKVRDLGWMMRQYRLFLNHGMGNFGTLLGHVTRDPAMIRWLDNETNQKGQANENFARELFELFTLGEGNYTEIDIQQSARAFTGWHTLHDQFHFSTTLHDDGTKTVLGNTGHLGGEDICRIALEQDACGRFLAGKLLRFFVTPAPDEAIVRSLGAELKARRYDMAATLELLFLSRYFHDPVHRHALIKSPLEFVVGSARVLGVNLDADAAVPALRALGQDLLAPPNVKGWTGHTDWINTATWLTRVNTARRLVNRLDPQTDGARAARTLLGRPVPAAEQVLLQKSGAGKRDLAHALLALPEAHLA